MDKKLFFGALPFLTKRPTSEWPPKLPKLTVQVIASELSLSVEVPQQGPILLLNAQDPALFICDLATIEPLSLASPSSDTTRLSQSNKDESSGQSSATTPGPIGEQDTSAHQIQLVFRVDKKDVYQVDFSHLMNSPSLVKGNKTEPASITLDFYTKVSFRLFSQTQTDRLRSLYDVLCKIPRVPTNPNMQQVIEEDSTKDKLTALEEGLNNAVQSLTGPASSAEDISQRLDRFASSVQYASSRGIQQAVTILEARIEEHDAALDELLATYFPSAKRQRQSGTDPASTTVSMDVCQEQTQAWMDRKQELVRERQRLAFLPIREHS